MTSAPCCGPVWGWFVEDGLGSVVDEVDPSGSVTANRKYDVFGQVRAQTGATTSKHEFVGALGHPSEAETGLVYMRARYMDPLTGRFISEDPDTHGDNWFAYCANNPVNNADADGKLWGYALQVLLNFAVTFLVNWGLAGVAGQIKYWHQFYMVQSLVSQFRDLEQQIFNLEVAPAEAQVGDPADGPA